jgi:hypothetical protein
VAISGSSIIYTPNPGYTGPDNLSYTIVDAYGNTSTASIDVTVAAGMPSNPLSAPEQAYDVVAGDTVILNVLAHDSGYVGIPYDVASIGTSISVPVNGVSAMSGSNISYTAPTSNPTGWDQFTYKLNDIFGDVVTGMVSLAITDAPLLNYTINGVLQRELPNNLLVMGENLPVQVTLSDPAAATTPLSFSLQLLAPYVAAFVSGATALASSGTQSVALSLLNGASATIFITPLVADSGEDAIAFEADDVDGDEYAGIGDSEAVFEAVAPEVKTAVIQTIELCKEPGQISAAIKNAVNFNEKIKGEANPNVLGPYNDPKSTGDVQNVFWVVITGENLEDCVATREFISTISANARKPVLIPTQSGGFQKNQQFGNGVPTQPDGPGLVRTVLGGTRMVIGDGPGLTPGGVDISALLPIEISTNFKIVLKSKTTGKIIGGITYNTVVAIAGIGPGIGNVQQNSVIVTKTYVAGH